MCGEHASPLCHGNSLPSFIREGKVPAPNSNNGLQETGSVLLWASCLRHMIQQDSPPPPPMYLFIYLFIVRDGPVYDGTPVGAKGQFQPSSTVWSRGGGGSPREFSRKHSDLLRPPCVEAVRPPLHLFLEYFSTPKRSPMPSSNRSRISQFPPVLSNP